jgi:hypothetical protein
MAAKAIWTLPAVREAMSMSLLAVYLATLVVGQSIAVGVGLFIDRHYSAHAGLMIFIALYFTIFWLAWRFAVRITAPKSQ